MRRIALVTLVVDDYDEAIRFYTEALGFRLVEDEPRPDGSRWVVVEPGTAGQGTGLLLARARGRDLGFERPQKAPQRLKEGRWCVISLAVGLVANR